MIDLFIAYWWFILPIWVSVGTLVLAIDVLDNSDLKLTDFIVCLCMGWFIWPLVLAALIFRKLKFHDVIVWRKHK